MFKVELPLEENPENLLGLFVEKILSIPMDKKQFTLLMTHPQHHGLEPTPEQQIATMC